ncbi:C4-dicarboxylate-specific signal transduction histidine kinase, partial [Polynucleobacter sphagniphilus]|uniref:ATP-binding protein n=1 Tax=Polynucleobacter sphagniphilus TaxID=1743169 RepID=UPI002473FB19
ELLIEMPERCYINANSIEIHQAILNVLNNAIQSLKSKNNIEKKHILIAINLQGEQVTINISDNGPGVPIEREHSLFELLDSQKESGMGLGLWLCKHIMTRHGGDIFYKRGSNAGATFSLVFPPPNPSR